MSDFHRFDPQIQTEDIAFRPDEMVACECGRTSAPNRVSCIYCGRRITTAVVDLASTAPLESWESGFNVVAMAANVSPADLARVIGREEALIAALQNSRAAVPLARVADEADAQRLANDLEAKVVADEGLILRDAPVRLSAIELLEDSISLIGFNTQARFEIGRDDLVLAVAGVLVKTRSESVEKRKKKSTTVLDESDSESREPLLDLYSKDDSHGFRILLTGFDFSVLGEKKGLLGEKNLAALVEFLRATCPNLKVVEDYVSLRPILDHVWPIETQNHALGQRTVKFRKTGFAKAATTSNLEQFTRFSRLQWHVL